MARTLKVSATVKLDVDVEAWALDYGMDPQDVSGIRKDVQRYVNNLVIEHLRGLELAQPSSH